MCLICLDLSKEFITPKEARNHLREMGETISKEHLSEVMELIDEKESELYKLRGDLD